MDFWEIQASGRTEGGSQADGAPLFTHSPGLSFMAASCCDPSRTLRLAPAHLFLTSDNDLHGVSNPALTKICCGLQITFLKGRVAELAYCLARAEGAFGPAEPQPAVASSAPQATESSAEAGPSGQVDLPEDLL